MHLPKVEIITNNFNFQIFFIILQNFMKIFENGKEIIKKIISDFMI